MSFLRVLHRPPCGLRVLSRRNVASAAPATTSAKSTPAHSSTATPLSSCPPDTKLEGANFLKGQAPVLALSDDQYPEWLWTVLQPKVYADDGPGGKAERVKRRKENKQKIKDSNFMSTQ